MTQIMTMHEALDTSARDEGFESWDKFTANHGEKKDLMYWMKRNEILQDAFELYSKNQADIRQEMSRENYDLKMNLQKYEVQQKKFGKIYRELIGEQIAQVKAVMMLNSMIDSNHTHRAKSQFAAQFNTVLAEMISTLKNKALTGPHGFGDYSGDDLPF